MSQLHTLEENEEIKMIETDQIVINPYQPRAEFKPEELEELSQSILSVGFIHPPVVRPLPNSDLFELISGERRLRAAQLLQLKIIPVHIRHTSSHLSAQAALIENIQRVDLNPLEISYALKKLMTDFGFNQEVLSKKIGKKRSTVANYLRLLSLPQIIQTSLLKNLISMGHAKAILSIEKENRQILLHELILRDQLNVRETEAAANRIEEKAKKQQLTHETRDFYLEHLEQKIQEKLGTKVSIQAKGKKGRLLIDYYNYDDLERLLNLLGINEND